MKKKKHSVKKEVVKKKIEKLKQTIIKLFLNKKNLSRDVAVVVIAIGMVVLFFINNQHLFREQNELVEIAGEPVIQNEAENPTIDTTNWKTFQTNWYGFEIKYPENWNEPISKGAERGSKWEYRYKFRKSEVEESNPYVGFDVVVYSVGKVKELSGTDEFPTVKIEEMKAQGLCEELAGDLSENENYPAEQIYVSPEDSCYNLAYFYTLTRDNYIYNIAPILADDAEKNIQSEKEVTQYLPEFISASSTFNLVDIARPKPKPRITAPKPYVYDVDGAGRRVCDKSNDHPSKSNKGKGKHLDMECCLDPDEYPNPWCYYNPSKYGKYL